MVSGLMGGIAGGATVGITIKAIDKYSKEFTKSKSMMQKFGKVMAGVAIASTAAFAAFTASAVKAGLALIPIEDSFRKLAKNSSFFLSELNDTTKGTVSNFELMSNANKALLLGLDQEALPNLFKNAAIVGRAAGRTTTEAIADITLGIGRQSRLILDNLGIILKADDVYKVYVASVGKATSELSAQEKQMAFNAAAMEALQESADKLGGIIPEDALTNIQQLNKGLKDFQAEFGKAFIQNVETNLPKSNKAWAEWGRNAGQVLGIITTATVLTMRTIELTIRTVIGAITVLLGASLTLFETFINKLIHGYNAVAKLIGKRPMKDVDIAGGFFKSGDKQLKKSLDLFTDLSKLYQDLEKMSKNIGPEAQTGGTTATPAETKQILTGQEKLVKRLNDSGFLLLPSSGDIFNPNKFLKRDFESPSAFGEATRDKGVVITIENIYGVSPDEIARAMSDELNLHSSI